MVSQLNDFYNKVKQETNVICDRQTGMKIYVKDDDNTIEFKGCPFDLYYKKANEVHRVNPLEKEDVKTNLLDLPD